MQKSSERLEKAEEKSSDERKKRRKMLKVKNITTLQKTIANEGPTYKAGDFALVKKSHFNSNIDFLHIEYIQSRFNESYLWLSFY